MCDTTTTDLAETHPTDGVATAVVRAVADLEGVAPTDLSICLADYLDGDALDALFASGRERAAMELATTVGPYEVAVSTAGVVVATDPCENPEQCDPNPISQ